jgi:hypothetical protein
LRAKREVSAWEKLSDQSYNLEDIKTLNKCEMSFGMIAAADELVASNEAPMSRYLSREAVVLNYAADKAIV